MRSPLKHYQSHLRSTLLATGFAAGSLAVGALLSAPEVYAQGSLQLIDFGGFSSMATAVSDDGSVVVGRGFVGSVQHGYRWSELGGTQVIGDTLQATGVSGDGAIVVGTYFGVPGFAAFRWQAGSYTLLPGESSSGAGISADGGTIVGRSYDDDANDWGAVKWDPGLTSLWVPGGASAASSDGSVIVGSSEEGSAMMWTNGSVQTIGPGGASDVSEDGSVVVGNYLSGGAGHAFRWTAAGGFQDLGAWSAGAVSADGNVIVGATPGSGAVLWTLSDGVRPLADVLNDLNIPVPPGVSLLNAVDITPDGRIVVGTVSLQPAHSAGSAMRAFRAVLDGQCVLRAGQAASFLDSALIAWTAAGSGQFGTGSNWAGGHAPGRDSVALFNQTPDPFTVSFSEFVTNDAVVATELNDATLALSGQTYDLEGAEGCFSGSIGVLSGARAAIQGGTALAHADVLVDPVFSATATELVVEQGATLIVDSDQDEEGALYVAGAAGGEGPLASVVVRDGGQLVNRNEAHVGESGRGPGELIVDGAGSRLSDGDLYVHEGTVLVQDGGEMSIDILDVGDVPSEAGDVQIGSDGRLVASEGIVLGSEAGASGRLVLEGQNARASAPVISVGEAGSGQLLLQPETELTISGLATIVGHQQGSDGLFSVISAEADVSTLIVGARGTGTLLLSDGTVFATRVAAGGASPGDGGTGTISLVGPAARLFVTEAVDLGRGGAGVLRIAGGGVVQATHVILYSGGSLGEINGTIQAVVVRAPPPAARGGGAGVFTDTLDVHDGAGVHVDSLAVLPGGVIGGSGAMPVSFTNAGTIAPADTAGGPGGFTAAAGLAFAPEGALEVDLFGAEPGQYDRLNVVGTLQLDGVLRVAFAGSFVPTPGQAFDLVAAGAIAGEFTSVEGPPGSTFSLAYGPTAVTATVLTVAAEPPPGTPAALALHPPAPNPTMGVATIRFDLPAAGRVRLAVYDALGREVAVLSDGERPAGAHEAVLEAGALAPGLYVLRLAAGAGARVRTLTVFG